ncbi:hypothetical protein ACF0H5_012552 [Mactra antiquata]
MEVPTYHRRRRRTLAPTGGASEDGDFVQLRLIREQSSRMREERKLLDRDESSMSFHLPKSTTKTDTDTHPPDKLDENTKAIFEAIDENDHKKAQTLLYQTNKISKLQHVRHEDTSENVLHYALSHGAKDLAKHIISMGGSDIIMSHHPVHKSGVQGHRNSLHIVTENNDHDMAVFVLQKLSGRTTRLSVLQQETAVEIQGQRPRLLSCMHLAAYYGYTQLVKLYLDYGVDVNTVNGKHDTALLWAARWGHNDTVALLLEHGADTEISNDKGSTALYWAIRYQHPTTVSLLLKKGKAKANTIRKVGLVSPIIIASAFGNADIVSELLKCPEVDVNLKIRGGDTAIHNAAREGWTKIVRLLTKRGATFDRPDDVGDTPLLLAAKYGHANIVKELLSIGADTNHKNHEGFDVWYFAIENEDTEILQLLASGYFESAKSRQNPICLAAKAGKCDKIDFLLSINFDPKTNDDEGNTFLHHAAMFDQYEVIDKFHSTISLNIQNTAGNTPLHIACKKGHTKSINTFLNHKAKADVKNKKGETPLHVAAYAKDMTSEAAKLLVEYTIKTHAWESLNDKDFEGNNCLHIAGEYAPLDVLWEFRSVRISDKDKDGFTPLHCAVRPEFPAALDMMLDIFENTRRDASINEETYDTKETVLHLASAAGHAENVRRLISLGADITSKDINGDTVFHRLTKACSEDNRNIQQHLDVFDAITSSLVVWWCIDKEMVFPEDQGDTWSMKINAEAVRRTMNETNNNDGLSVVNLAFKLGVPEILSRIIMMPEVTMFENTSYTFDITGLTPRTNNELGGCCGRSKIAPLESQKNKKGDTTSFTVSGIELLINNDAKSNATDIMNLPPIRSIERYYTSMVAWTFAIVMVFHIAYMSAFTYLGVEQLSKLRENESLINTSDVETLVMYIVVPIEPALILFYVIYNIIQLPGDVSRRKQLCNKRGLSLVLHLIGSYFFIVVCAVFAILTLVWIWLFTERYTYQDYILALALCIGWILSISFTRGIRAIHYYYRMLISIIMKDIVRFIVVYAFFLMAFGFAFHVLFQISSSVVDIYTNPGDTLFLTFNMMIGMGELFDDEFQTGMSDVGRETAFIKVFYIVYIILGTIILLNLLIAMMNDSYSMILQENQAMWRIDSVSLGLDIESNFPSISKVFTSVKILKGGESNDQLNDRWYVTMTTQDYQEYMKEFERQSRNSTDAVTKRLDDLDSKISILMKQTTEKFQQMSSMLESSNAERKHRKLRRAESKLRKKQE